MPIDQNIFNILRTIQPESEPNFLDRLIDLFLSSAQDNITQLQQSFKDNDIELLTRAAHTLKSSSGNIGAMELMKVCAELEVDCREDNLTRCSQQVTAIAREFERVKVYFSAPQTNE